MGIMLRKDKPLKKKAEHNYAASAAKWKGLISFGEVSNLKNHNVRVRLSIHEKHKEIVKDRSPGASVLCLQ